MYVVSQGQNDAEKEVKPVWEQSCFLIQGAQETTFIM